jgi:CHAT domain-containing protein
MEVSMPSIDYPDFRIVISCLERGKRYKAVASCILGGDSQEEQFNMTEVMPDAPPVADAPEQSRRHITVKANHKTEKLELLFDQPLDEQKAKDFGDRLFRAVFKNTIRSLFDTCWAKSRKLRLRFNLTSVPELAALPWEYLHNSDKDHFFAQFEDTPIVRYQGQLTEIAPLKIEPPLRILVMTAVPEGYEVLDDRKELESIKEGIQPIKSGGLVEIEMLPKATAEALLEKLQSAQKAGKPFHIFHYIGHGVFNPQTKEGALLLENENGEATPVGGDVIGAILHSFRDNLRLVVLNTCEGARASTSSSYSGFAQKVMQSAEIPAAIGMQFTISDEAAIIFAEKFYGAIAEGKPLESALSQARLQLFAHRNREWATPTLYLRAQDGYILVIQTPAAYPSAGVKSLPHLSEHFSKVRDAFNDGQLVIFLGLDVNLYGRQLIEDWKPGEVLPANLELCDYLRRTYNYPRTGAPLASLAQHLAIKELRGKLDREFLKTFTAQANLPPLYPRLAQIVAVSLKRLQESNDPLRRQFLIVTTNYDDCFERAFSAQQDLKGYHVISYDLPGGKFRHTCVQNGKAQDLGLITSPNEYRGLLKDFPVILKLPGEVESGAPNFAVTEDDFFALASQDLIAMLPSEVVGNLRASSQLYLGYSPHDWPFRALLYSIWQDRKPRYLSWAVVTDANDENIAYWENCGVKIIIAPLEDYVRNLQQHLCD